MPTEPEGAGTEGLARIGDQLHQHNDDEGAADFYSRAIQHAPKDIRIRKSFAGILESHGDYNGAAAQYAEGLKVAPDDMDLLRGYGRNLVRLGRLDDAKATYEHALEVEPGDLKSMNGLGVALDLGNNHVAAQKIYQDALSAHPGDIATLANLGHSYVLSGAWTEAINLLEPHLHDTDATPALRQNLAEAYGMAGMDADAERVARMDLPPDQVRRNIAYYRSVRTHMAPAGTLIADLGSFPTEAMAQAHVERIKAAFAEAIDGLVVTIAPVVKTVGGTPSFEVHVTGFEKPAKAKVFCDNLKKGGAACVTRIEK